VISARLTCAAFLALAACPAPRAQPTADAAGAIAPTPCEALCDDEAKCAGKDATCIPACGKDLAILKPGVAAKIVDCRRETLRTNCYGKESALTHGQLLVDARCLEIAGAPFASDESNRRNFSAAACDRMIRCQRDGEASSDFRKLCIEASVHPSEAEDIEAMKLIDTLRDDVVAEWAKCLGAEPCPAPGQADERATACTEHALQRSQ
jgi:hypothetical protein